MEIHTQWVRNKKPFQLSFNASLKVDFQGSRVTSDGGLILVRELDASRRDSADVTGACSAAKFVVKGQERSTMHRKLSQIGNPDLMASRGKVNRLLLMVLGCASEVR
jgi:hypothetical protein